MNEVLKTILYQILGYFMAMGFAFALLNFWQRGYFWKYVRVRTSLGKLILIKLIETTKIVYKIGKIEEGNLTWGKPGKNGHILNSIKRDYIYKEQNVDCVDIDGETFAFIPKEVHFTKKTLPLPPNTDPSQYAKIFSKTGNEIIVAGVEGFDPQKVDSLIQRAQFKPSQINNTVKIILVMVVIGLLISGAAAIASFIAGDNVKKLGGQVSSIQGSLTAIEDKLTPPQQAGTVRATG